MPLLTIPSGNVASALGGGYEVANSCRFNDDDNPKMVVTPSSSGTNAGKIYTLSAWVKLGNIGVDKTIWSCSSDTYIYISNAGVITCNFRRDGGTNYEYGSSRKLRDPSAWYHIVLRVDTTDSTDADKVQVYVNNQEDTPATTTYQNMADDYETGANVSGVEQRIGVYSDGSLDFDGYMAEVIMVDNQSLAPTEFGEYDEDTPTVWKPKDISGISVGTNGYYLDFEDSSNLGNNAAGSGSADLTETNLAATDQSTDTCTNNFCTLNPLGGKKGNNTTFSEGNLKSVDTGSTNGVDPNLHATFGLTAGSWYFEMKAEAITAGRMASIALLVQDGQGPDDYADARTVNLYYEKNSSGNKIRKFSSDVETGLADNAADDIFGVALDIDNGTVQFYKNGSTYGSQVTGLSSSGKTTFISMLGEGGSGRAATCNLNFGSPAFAISSGNADGNGYGNFEHAVPSGFLALCTKNLGSDGG